MEEKIFQSLFIDVKFKNKTITFGCIYRAPCNDIVSNSSFLDILNNTLKRIKKRDCYGKYSSFEPGFISGFDLLNFCFDI